MSDRGQIYGDGFFETMLILEGIAPFLDFHHARLLRTSYKLKLELDEILADQDQFYSLVNEQIEPGETIRLRLNVIRKSGGFYLPLNSGVDFNFSKQPVANPLNKSGEIKKMVSIAESINLYSGGLSNYKTFGRSEQVLLSLEMKDRALDDLVVLNEQGIVMECISSNIFFIDHDGNHYSPPLSSGCLDGILRKLIILNTRRLNTNIHEKSMFVKDMFNFKSAYCTNSIQGIVPIAQINNTEYDVQNVFNFYKKLRQIILVQ